MSAAEGAEARAGHGGIVDRLLRRPWLAVLLAGALCALAMPPAGIFPVFWIGFPILLIVLRHGPGGWRAFWTGWLFGFGFFVIGLYWVAYALTVDFARFFWLLPFTVAGLPALLSVFFGIVTWAWRRAGTYGVPGVLLFAVLWGAGEWARGHLLTGFPWHLMAYGWDNVLPVAQLAALIGPYGLGIVTIAAAAMPAAILEAPAGGRKPALAASLLLAAVIAVGGTWGALRLASHPSSAESLQPGVTLRLVQPGIDQGQKWDAANWPAHFNLHLQLSSENAGGVTHVIWPETAATFFLDRDDLVRNRIAGIVPPGGAAIVGAPRAENWEGDTRYFNSAQVITEDGVILDSYDKSHLVPFGEYVPLARWIPFVEAVASTADYSPGPGLRTLSAPGLPPFSPLICYEAIFPGEVVASPAGEEEDMPPRPAWLLNITNDAWYGMTAGPHQHFAIARWRAIEEGLPLVRVATNGISGLVDPLGRIVATLPLGSSGVLDVPLPKPLVREISKEQ